MLETAGERQTESAKLTGVEEMEGLGATLKVLGSAKRLHLLRFLVHPHYLEEIASELRMARQTAQEHVEQLLEAGVIQRVRGRRDHGPVTDYVVVPQRLFAIYESVGKLGGLQPDIEPDAAVRPLTTPLQTGASTPREQDVPRLTIVHGMRIGQSTALVGNGPWLLGRDPHSTVCLDFDPYVSTRHAELRRTTAAFEVADLYSSNGTYADWKRVARGGTERIQNGAILRVGRSILVFRKPQLTD